MTPFAIPFPPLSPEIFSIDLGGFQFALRWYALAYIAGLLIGWRLIVAVLRRPALWGGKAPMAPELAETLLTWVILGVILGGRLGYALFYQPGYYLQNPEQILRVWEGGMSFHGGLLGVALAGFLFCRKHGVSPWAVSDAMAMVVGVGLFFGRIANFINAELWGAPTTRAWGVLFPGAGGICPPDWPHVCARHPTQLYEAALEGALLLLVVWYAVTRMQALARPGFVTGLFFAVYGAARFAVEFLRVPDAQFLMRHPKGHVLAFGEFGLTMGQLLSLPLLALGLVLLLRRV